MSHRVTAAADAPQRERTTPLTGEVVASLPESSVADVERAYEAARAAQPAWAATPVKERVEFLERLHDLVLEHQSEMLDLIQLDSGKARIQAFEEILDTAGVCRHYAKKAPSYLAERKGAGAMPVLTQARTGYRPKGVVGVVAPWVVLGLLAIRPEGAAAYATAGGVMVVLIGAAVSVVAYRLTLRLGRLPEPQRWFG